MPIVSPVGASFTENQYQKPFEEEKTATPNTGERRYSDKENITSSEVNRTKMTSTSTPTKVKGSTSSPTITPASATKSTGKKKTTVWSDDENDDIEAAKAASLAPKSATKGPSNRMTLEAIRTICKSRHDLYENIELNEKLFLNFGGFSTIESMHHFPDLKSLWLENNLIKDLAGLESLTKLRCLYLQNNQLTSLKGIEILSALVLLNASSNNLTDITGVSQLAHLQILDVHDNALTETAISSEFEKMTDAKYLHTLDLSQNQINSDAVTENKDNSSEVSSNTAAQPHLFSLLSQLPHLKVVYLKSNPLVEQVTQYRRVLSSMLPALSFLDDRPVSELDRTCAQAWKRGGREEEKTVRTVSLAEKREKEERNMKEWMKRKEERVAQLAALRAEQDAAKATNPSSSSSSSESSTVTSDDPQFSHRVYHASSAPIPASPYHGEIASVEYSSWCLRQETIEEEDVQAREQAKKEQQLVKEAQQKKTVASSSSSTSITALTSTPTAISDPLPTSSYFDVDSSDDPEIVSMKKMLHDVLLSTAAMKGPNQKTKRSHNIGVSEAALVDESLVDQEEAKRQAIEAELDAQSTAASSSSVPNLVAESSRPTTAATTEDGDVEASSNTSSGSTTPTGPNVAPNNFSILDDLTIAQIYEQTKVQLPSVDVSDDDAANDVSDIESEEEEPIDLIMNEGLTSPKSPLKSPGSKKASKVKMPKILGFGPDDAHLINRPFFGSMMGASASAQEDVTESLADHDWEPIPATATTSSTSTATPSKTLSLADLLASRRQARLGTSSHKSAGTSTTTNGSRRPTARGVTNLHADLEAQMSNEPSSMATGITAESLLTSFIQSQSASPPPVTATSSSTDPRYTLSGERYSSMEREQKNELFLAASSVLDVTHRTSFDSDEEDEEDKEEESSDDADEDSVPVDPRLLAQEARRQARQQR